MREFKNEKIEISKLKIKKMRNSRLKVYSVEKTMQTVFIAGCDKKKI